MKKYLGVKMIEAVATTHGEYAMEKYGNVDSKLSTIDPSTEGYKVIYDNDYVSWSPKDVFEASYFPISDEEGSKINLEDVQTFMGDITGNQVDEVSTLVKCESVTGFTQYAISSCVSPDNYNTELGKKYGTEELVSKYWHCLGFVLKWAKNGLKK